MRYYKRLPLNRKDPMSSTFAVETDGRIVTNTSNSLEIPSGTAAQRPANPVNGQIRYNTSIGSLGGELEAYVDGSWQIIKTNRQQNITLQEFDNGDYADTLFGPLTYNISTSTPQNVLVFVENVPQIAGANYVLRYSAPGNQLTTSSNITQFTPANTTTLHVSSVADFNAGQPISGSGIVSTATIVSSSVTSLTVQISVPTSTTISTGTLITSTIGTGTWIQFVNSSLPVPYKPVYVLLGFDGYTPPFEV